MQKIINGEMRIPDDQFIFSIWMRLTCLVNYPSKSGREGCPEVVFFDKVLPELGKGQVQSSVSTTLMYGSDAAGEVLRPNIFNILQLLRGRKQGA